MATLADLGVVVSVKSGEPSWVGLLEDLSALPLGAEIIMTGSEMPTANLPELRRLSAGRKVKWLPNAGFRGPQWNHGARVTQKPYLWFLTSGTRFAPRTLPALEKSLRRAPQSLHYFDLEFMREGGALSHFTHFNDALAWTRSHFMALPLGNQGFCLSHVNFDKLGGFPEDVPAGEDHLLIWKAHREGVSLECTGALLRSSARDFRKDGWAWTTLQNGKIMLGQALPQVLKLLKKSRGD